MSAITPRVFLIGGASHQEPVMQQEFRRATPCRRPHRVGPMKRERLASVIDDLMEPRFIGKAAPLAALVPA